MNDYSRKTLVNYLTVDIKEQNWECCISHPSVFRRIVTAEMQCDAMFLWAISCHSNKFTISKPALSAFIYI